MRLSFLPSLTTVPADRCAPGWIAVGFALLLAGAFWPVMPVVTAMAFIALGATGATAHRLRTAPARGVVIAAHLFVYLNLYLLLVGAVCHAASQGPQNGVTIFDGADLGISLIPMSLVVRRSLSACLSEGHI